MAASERSDSVIEWLSELQAGRREAANELWRRYYPKLIRLAGRRLPSRLRRTCDEEDVAASAFASFCAAAEEGRLPKIDDRDDLWKILAVVAVRKVSAQIRKSRAKKRGEARVRGESVFGVPGNEDAPPGIAQVVGREPTPEFAAAVSEQIETFLAALPDETLRAVAVDKLAGYSNVEIAQRRRCVERTIARKLNVIRAVWRRIDPQAADDELE